MFSGLRPSAEAIGESNGAVTDRFVSSASRARVTAPSASRPLRRISTREGRVDALTLPWPQLRYQHTQAVRRRLAERYHPATVNKSLAAVRGVLKEAWRIGFIQAADYHRAVALRGVSAHTLPLGRALSAGEIRALFVTCAADRSPAGARDAAMLAVLYSRHRQAHSRHRTTRRGTRRQYARIGNTLVDVPVSHGSTGTRGR